MHDAISIQLHISIMKVIQSILDCEIIAEEEKMTIIITALMQTIAEMIGQNIESETDIPNLINNLAKQIETVAIGIHRQEQSIQ